MDVVKIIDTLKFGIANDEAISVWCQAKYGKEHTVFVGNDPEKPVQKSECPCVIMYPVIKKIDRADDYKIHGFGVTCQIFERDKQEIDNICEYVGLRLVEQFRKLTENAIVEASKDFDSTLIQSLYIDYSDIDDHPYYLSSIGIEFNEAFSHSSPFWE